ncbi:hypothetical protein [Paenibacillus amylolyticus]|uniref:hypothetical protein n=1 Tax=Paenibacillus amylolyticus TaxID=1451 RepID=UPI003396BCE4
MEKDWKVFYFDDGMPFGVVWHNQDELLELIKQEMEVFNETVVITEITEEEELVDYIFTMGDDQGLVLLNGMEIIPYLRTNNIVLEGPLIT